MALTIVAFTLGISTAVCAQQTRQSHEEAFDRVVNELNLNSSQQDEITKQKNSQKDESQKVKAQLKEKRNELKSELEKESSDKAKIDAIISDMKELIAQRIQQRVESILALKKVLSPEQFKALNEKAKNLFEKKAYDK